ncbi:universal stress protein [Robertkochia solimangrovi]|uniref:universal stress protein n=1 Tax=Robertkochia solimangrovi TaxID=2213046 RepID=UPI00117CEFBC|nr:universal stress protein [Robertkochia solimangrovi]TRZ40980.1 hypothetical protein DMZ48_18470 [Robertkochia solimangrovi]
MMKRILILTDFSKNAWDASCYASEAFAFEETEFYLLHVLKPLEYESVPMIGLKIDSYIPDPDKEKKAKVELMKLIHRLNQYKNPKHEFEPLLRTGFIIDVIKEAVKTNHIDMIILGTKGAKRILNIYFGSTALKILDSTFTCPVLAIPEHWEYKGIREVVMPTDFCDPVREENIYPLLELLKDFHCHVRLLHVQDQKKELNEDQLYCRRRISSALNGIPHQFHTLVNFDEANGIGCFAQSHNADLIVFVYKKHSFIESIAHKSTLKGVSYRTAIPIMVLHQNTKVLKPKKDAVTRERVS